MSGYQRLFPHSRSPPRNSIRGSNPPTAKPEQRQCRHQSVKVLVVTRAWRHTVTYTSNTERAAYGYLVFLTGTACLREPEVRACASHGMYIWSFIRSMQREADGMTFGHGKLQDRSSPIASYRRQHLARSGAVSVPP